MSVADGELGGPQLTYALGFGPSMSTQLGPEWRIPKKRIFAAIP